MTTSAVREAALLSERIDTHAHIGDGNASLREQCRTWDRFANAKDLMGSRIAAEGCRRLFGVDPGSFLRPDAPDELFDRSDELRSDGAYQSLLRALGAAGIQKQLIFADCVPERMRPMAEGHVDGRIYYLAYIDNVLNGDGHLPSPEFDDPAFNHYRALCDIFGELDSFDDLLGHVESAMQRWPSWGAVGMKSAMAYTYGLEVTDPGISSARSAFSRREHMTIEDRRVVHDFAFRRSLEVCIRENLPVVVHTGYQIWGGASLAQANPLRLHRIIADRRYRDARFVLLHGGNPYVGETTYLAGQFPNVYIDFTWLPWMSPTRFRFALSEWLNVIPHDRFCWGTDAGTPEGIVGADSISRRAIADVLESEIKSGTIDAKYALEFVTNSYLRTPAELFGLG
jgi:hypothetical protein